jgi:hypothetical protein
MASVFKAYANSTICHLFCLLTEQVFSVQCNFLWQVTGLNNDRFGFSWGMSPNDVIDYCLDRVLASEPMKVGSLSIYRITELCFTCVDFTCRPISPVNTEVCPFHVEPSVNISEYIGIPSVWCVLRLMRKNLILSCQTWLFLRKYLPYNSDYRARSRII